MANLAPTINTVSTGYHDISRKNTAKATNVSEDGINNTLKLSQPLFNFGSGVFGLKAAQNAVKAAMSAYYLAEQNEILNAINAYLTLIETSKAYDASKTSHQSAQVIFDSIKAKFEFGLASVIDVSIAEANLASYEYNESAALVAYEGAKGNFRIFFGDLSMDVTWPDISEDFLNIGLDKFTEKVMSCNYDLLRTKYESISKKINSRSSAGAILPSVTFNAEAAHVYNSAQNDKTNYTLSVTVNAPILNLKTNSSIRSAKIDSRAAVYTFDQTLKALEQNITKSWETYYSTKVSLAASEKAVNASQISFDGVSDQYKLGEKSLTDVLQIEQDLLKAKIQNITARKNYLLALYQMKSIPGDLTAKELGLQVKYFRPEMEFKKMRANVLGVNLSK